MKKSILITIIVLVAIVGGSVSFVLLRPKPSPYEFATVAKQNIIQEVSVTGKVKPAEAVDLAFEKNGKINKIYKEVGQPVSQGEAILSLDSSELQSQLNQAQAQLEIQQINLQTLQKGARSEEISVLQTKLSNAQKTFSDSQTNLANVQTKAVSDLANLYNNVTDILHSAYAEADDAVNKQIDDLFSNANSDSPQLTFQTSNFQYEISSEQQRVTSGDALKEFKEILDNLNSSYTDLDLALTTSEQKLAVVRDFLNTLTFALNSSSNLSSATLTAYKGYVNTGRTNINAAITAINAQKQSVASQKITNQQNIATAQAGLTTAQNSIENAQRDLDLKKVGATSEQLRENEAQIKSAQANIQNLAIQIAKTTLRSPLDGIVSKQIVKIGQVITANVNVVSIISQANFQIEANIAEADIAKIQIGNQAKTTLDAYGSDVIFSAMVIKIEPAETVIEGVPTYKTTFSFTENSDKIKSGMTANIDVLTAQKENVLAVPYRAIIAKNGDKIVRVMNGEKIEERQVTLGLRGSDGFIEITSGLNEGEKIITFEKKR